MAYYVLGCLVSTPKKAFLLSTIAKSFRSILNAECSDSAYVPNRFGHLLHHENHFISPLKWTKATKKELIEMNSVHDSRSQALLQLSFSLCLCINKPWATRFRHRRQFTLTFLLRFCDVMLSSKMYATHFFPFPNRDHHVTFYCYTSERNGSMHTTEMWKYSLRRSQRIKERKREREILNRCLSNDATKKYQRRRENHKKHLMMTKTKFVCITHLQCE